MCLNKCGFPAGRKAGLIINENAESDWENRGKQRFDTGSDNPG